MKYFDLITKQLFALIFAGLAVIAVSLPALAEERTLTPEQLEALQSDGELGGEKTERPTKLPDLTKGEPAGEPGKYGERVWPLGPTGMFGHLVGGPAGDQIEVTEVQKGSPAEGVMKWGDVIIGVGGKKFVAGEHMGMTLGNAIIQAERETNGGKLKLLVWRDLNMLARNAKKDIRGTDVDDLIDKANSDDTLYDWKSEEAQEQEARSANYDEFPIKPEMLEITLQLEVMPDYSETSPYNCPKAKRILENAYKVLEQQFEAGKITASRTHANAALALVASGKPEHRELVREWVRSPKAKQWHPSIADSMDIMRPRGYESWRMSFDGLDAAVYYDATGDAFVLPAIEAYAVHTAKGQAGGGSWGHQFAWPVFNGGQLHGMNPGYGALNAAGNRCFMLIALAKKQGIEHPEIDLAIERASKFFGSYYEKGAIPYGHHGAAASDDSNGKNVGVAFAFKLLGDDAKARWFAQMSSHASFTRRGGHGSGYLWHYTPLAATMLGPEITIASHRNLRWRFTLCRMHDGSFTCHSNYGRENLRNPTATYVLHYSAPMKQTLWTGKDADEDMFWTDEEFQQLLTVAQGQFNDESLIERAGPRVHERSTDEVFTFLDNFKPKHRGIFARELGKRYRAGEKEILPRLAGLLESDNPRLRGAACRALEACGPDATLQYLSGVARLLNDPEEFVRMHASSAVAKASESEESQVALLKTAIDDSVETMSPNSTQSVIQGAVFTKDNKLATKPFESGLDDKLVRAALEKLLTLDPAGNRPLMGSRDKVWGKDTAARIAGPLIFAAEQEQIADQMFSGRRKATLGYLESLGYQEAVDAGVSYLRKYNDLPRTIRQHVYFKRGNVEGDLLMRHPAQAKQYTEALNKWMLDKPLAMAFVSKEEPNIALYELIDTLKAQKRGALLPSLAEEAEKVFLQELEPMDSKPDRIAYCREELSDPARRNYIRQIAALRYLVETVGPEDTVGDVLPYLTHEHWRVQEVARGLGVELVKANGTAPFAEALKQGNAGQAVGVLAVLARAKPANATALAKQALSHEDPAVAAAAAQAYFAIAGDKAVPDLFELMQRATDKQVLLGCEDALLSRRGDGSLLDRVRAEATAMLASGGYKPMLRETLYWLIAQCSGPAAMKALNDALAQADEQAAAEIVNALSYSPDMAADKVLLDYMRANTDRRDRAKLQAAAKHSVRRMLIGPDGINTRPTDQQLDWAQTVIDLTLDDSTIKYLGRIKTGRSAFILQKAMRRGATTAAAQTIIEATNRLDDAPQSDLKLAESALVDTIEFIEVTYLRGGASDQLKSNPEAWRTYAKWKAITTQAGKNLLKISKLKAPEPLDEFDDSDLDF